MSARGHLASQNLHYLEQGLALLERLDDAAYTSPVLGARSGAVGSQFRHVLDYYACFVRDLASGRIDYDRRERDPAIEESPASAAEACRALIEHLDGLGGLGAIDADRALEVKADRMGEGVAPGETRLWSRSSVQRELAFLLSHTVHHFALIALMLRTLDHEVPEHFGVAPSTLEHWKSSRPCAR